MTTWPVVLLAHLLTAGPRAPSDSSRVASFLPEVRTVVYSYYDLDRRNRLSVALSDSGEVAEIVSRIRLVPKGSCLCEHIGRSLDLVAGADTLHFSICDHCLNLRDTTTVFPGIYNQIGFRMPAGLWSRLEELRLREGDDVR